MLNNILDELKLNALVITDPYNMRHVSGFRGGEGALYISATQKVLITDSRYTEQAGKESDFTVIEENRAHNRQPLFLEQRPVCQHMFPLDKESQTKEVLQLSPIPF